MKTMYLIAVGCVILLFIFWKLLISNINSEVNKVSEKVGLKLVIEKDTLMILNYSILNNSYTLSNGKEVSIELVDNLKTIK